MAQLPCTRTVPGGIGTCELFAGAVIVAESTWPVDGTVTEFGPGPNTANAAAADTRTPPTATAACSVLTASLPARDAADGLPAIDDVPDAIDPANQDRRPIRHGEPYGHEERPAEV